MLGPQPGAGGLGEDGHGAAEGDELGELCLVVDLGAGSRRVRVVAWLLRRSPNILLIPGTSSVAHLRENVTGAGLPLSGEEFAELEKTGR